MLGGKFFFFSFINDGYCYMITLELKAETSAQLAMMASTPRGNQRIPRAQFGFVVRALLRASAFEIRSPYY